MKLFGLVIALYGAVALALMPAWMVMAVFDTRRRARELAQADRDWAEYQRRRAVAVTES